MALRDKVEAGADLILAACLAGVQPEKVTSWVSVTHLDGGGVKIRTDACCVHHAARALLDSIGPAMAQLPPCTHSGG